MRTNGFEKIAVGAAVAFILFWMIGAQVIAAGAMLIVIAVLAVHEIERRAVRHGARS